MRLLLRRLGITTTALGPPVLTAATSRSRGRCRLSVTSGRNACLGPPPSRRVTPTATPTGQSRRRSRPNRGRSVWCPIGWRFPLPPSLDTDGHRWTEFALGRLHHLLALLRGTRRCCRLRRLAKKCHLPPINITTAFDGVHSTIVRYWTLAPSDLLFGGSCICSSLRTGIPTTAPPRRISNLRRHDMILRFCCAVWIPERASRVEFYADGQTIQSAAQAIQFIHTIKLLLRSYAKGKRIRYPRALRRNSRPARAIYYGHKGGSADLRA